MVKGRKVSIRPESIDEWIVFSLCLILLVISLLSVQFSSVSVGVGLGGVGIAVGFIAWVYLDGMKRIQNYFTQTIAIIGILMCISSIALVIKHYHFCETCDRNVTVADSVTPPSPK